MKFLIPTVHTGLIHDFFLERTPDVRYMAVIDLSRKVSEHPELVEGWKAFSQLERIVLRRAQDERFL